MLALEFLAFIKLSVDFVCRAFSSFSMKDEGQSSLPFCLFSFWVSISSDEGKICSFSWVLDKMRNAMESRSLRSELFSKLDLNTGKLGLTTKKKNKCFLAQENFIIQCYELGFKTCSLGLKYKVQKICLWILPALPQFTFWCIYIFSSFLEMIKIR